MAANVNIYTGFWTNWSGGAIAGSTLTLNLQQGAYLVAFLALYVRLVGTHMWQLISYCVFQVKASSANADSLDGHQLLVLRNVSTDFGAMFKLAKAAWKDRRNSRRVVARSILLVLAAAIHGVAFAAAGILASRVTNAKSDALLRSNVCGTWSPDYSVSTFGMQLEQMKYEASLVEDVVQSSQFVAECYNGTSLANCNTFGRRLLDYDTSRHKSCPFGSEMCTNDTVVRLDSGYIDSLYDLGINSQTSDRVSFRKTLECSPIVTEGFTKTYTTQNLTSNISDFFNQFQSTSGSYFTAFFYGENLNLEQKPTFVFDNSTFDASSDSVPTPFYTDTEFAWPNTTPSYYSTFKAIPQLSPSTGAVLLIFLAKYVSYATPVLDPWFQADFPAPPDLNIGVDYTSYDSKNHVAVLGCTANTQICNPVAGNKCVPFMPESEADTLGPRLNLNKAQTSIVARLQNFLILDISWVFEALGGQGLLAYQSVTGNISPGLRDDQWILEVQHAFSVLLNFLQLQTTNYVTGYGTNNKYVQPPQPDGKWMCNNQIVQRNDYASFSVLGLCIILIVGGLIMLANMLLRGMRFQRSVLGRHRAQWRSMELLELQPRQTYTELMQLQSTPIEDVMIVDDEKVRPPSTSSNKKTLLSAVKAIGPRSWKPQDAYAEVHRHSDDVWNQRESYVFKRVH